MNLVDLIALSLCLLAAVRGWRLGLFGQVFELGGGFLGLILGALIARRVAPAFTDGPGLEAALISLGIIFVGLSLGQALGFVLGRHFASLTMQARLGGFDSAIGAAFGIGLTLVSLWLIASMLVDGPSRPVARAVQRSQVLRYVNAALPRPPDVFAYVRQYLRTSGFPQVFLEFPRPVGPPVKLPKDEVARRAIVKADQSTVRIIVPACGGQQLGSGWIAAPATVVTNAHVVSGGDAVTVVELSGGEHSGSVVLFDPKTDVAIVHVEGLSGPPLDLETSELERGTPGATLGYPGGSGQLTWHRAAVQDHYSATGRDIYGRSVVTRDVYEVRSPVRQGDSGGPFVLPNGDVAAVVFAASTTQGDVGYTLTGAEVADEVRRGSKRTSPVGTGRCTH